MNTSTSLVEWTHTLGDSPEEKCIHELFEAQVKRTPHALAVASERQRVTYSYLNERSNQLAHYLTRQGVGPEVTIGICMERSVEMTIAILGILKAGGAYVPLDPEYPQERLAFMVDDSRIEILLSQNSLVKRLSDSHAQVICLDDWNEISRESTQNPVSDGEPDNLAYVIYTSGSTGKPKGVMIDHRALVNYTLAAGNAYAIRADDRVLQFSSISFDISIEEIFLCLTRGATLVLRTPEMLDPSLFLQKCYDWNITVLSLPTSYWHQLTKRISSDGIPPSVRLLILGGEKAQPQDLERWRKYVGPNLQLINSYGPTETTVVATLYDLSAFEPSEISLREIPIGTTIPNLQAHLLDELFHPVRSGVAGELLIGGVGLARGYLNRPDLTAEKFVPHPFSPEPGTRLYRTGDLARYLPDGNLEFVGRVDHQVKVRGYRIELEEIEAVLNQHEAVHEAIVAVRENAVGEKQLVAYVVRGALRQGALLEASELRIYLQQRVPAYMVPSTFVLLDELPRLPSGKVNREALPSPDMNFSELESAYVPPRSELERWLTELWQEVLGVKEKIGVHDSFFELGGDSIKGASLINRLEKELGEYLYIVSLFEAPTIAQFASYLARHYPDSVLKSFGGTLQGADAQDSVTPSMTMGRIDAFKVAQLRQLVAPIPHRTVSDRPLGTRNPPAIFILSSPRSGSTLLRVMLAGHPRLFAPPELDLLSFNTLEERKLCRSSQHSFGFLEGTIRTIMEIKGCDAEQARAIMEECEQRKLSTKEFYRLLQSWIGERILVDKSTSYELDLETLKRAETDFENPLYLHLTRHPYGMIRSFEEVRMDRIFFRDGHPFSVRQLAELTWLISHQNILEFLKEIPGRRQHRVKFEALVEDPKNTMERVCEFLGLEFDSAVTQPYKDKEKRMTDGIFSVSRMIGDVKFHDHQDVNPEIAGRWKQFFTEDFLGEITWDVATSLGYERDGSSAKTAFPTEGAHLNRILGELEHLSEEEAKRLLAEERRKH